MCAGGGASVDACGCLAFVRPSQLVVYGGTSVVNGQLHFPKDVYSFDLGGWRLCGKDWVWLRGRVVGDRCVTGYPSRGSCAGLVWSGSQLGVDTGRRRSHVSQPSVWSHRRVHAAGQPISIVRGQWRSWRRSVHCARAAGVRRYELHVLHQRPLAAACPTETHTVPEGRC